MKFSLHSLNKIALVLLVVFVSNLQAFSQNKKRSKKKNELTEERRNPK